MTHLGTLSHAYYNRDVDTINKIGERLDTLHEAIAIEGESIAWLKAAIAAHLAGKPVPKETT